MTYSELKTFFETNSIPEGLDVRGALFSRLRESVRMRIDFIDNEISVKNASTQGRMSTMARTYKKQLTEIFEALKDEKNHNPEFPEKPKFQYFGK